MAHENKRDDSKSGDFAWAKRSGESVATDPVTFAVTMGCPLMLGAGRVVSRPGAVFRAAGDIAQAAGETLKEARSLPGEYLSAAARKITNDED